MKISMYIIITAVLAMAGRSLAGNPQPVSRQPVKTVIYLIRHAEKADASANPHLSAAGLQRADQWGVILQGVTFGAFYSTNYYRTLQTIQPTASRNGKEVTRYDPANFALEDVIAAHGGTNVLIIGHSNTIPKLINAYLGADTYPDMGETEFSNLYKISIVDGVVSHEVTVHN